MDLTYMPGELDHKNPKKNNGSDMKREHDSVDDFEHLDPELSPVDIQQKDFPAVEKLDSKLDTLSEKSLKKDNIVPDPFFEGFSNDGISSPKNPLESTADIVSGSKDLLSDFDSDYQQFNTKVGLNNQEQSSLLDFGVGGDFSPSSVDDEIDVRNKSFIAAEVAGNSNKTEHESDLLNLGGKAKDNFDDVQELPVVDNKSSAVEKSTEKAMDFDDTKSMKEADALSQYDIKYDRKTGGNKFEPTEEDKDEKEPFFQPEIPVPEPIANILPDLPKPEQQPTEHVLHSENPKSEPLEDHGEPSDEVPVKPFIAICPAKPTPSETTTEKNVSKKMSLSDLDDIIGPEDVFKRIGLVEALVYWRDPKKSGVVFGGIMAILLSLCYMSLISVVAYSSLLALTGTICFRIYKNILQAVQKTSEGHPFKEFLDLELSLPQDKVREMADTAVVHVNAAIVELRRLFLVEDLIDSIKFGVCLWCLTYVGAIFNGMTIVILAFVALFTVPKIYENNKASIDTYIEMGRSKVAEITSKVKAAVPIGKKEPEKDKEQ